MAIPRKLLRAAFSSLPLATLRKAAEHNEIRGREGLSAEELSEKLAKNESNLCSITGRLSAGELKKIAAVFELEVKGLGKDDLDYAVWSFVSDYDEIQERKKSAAKGPALPTMELQTLLDAGEEIAREVRHLVPAPKKGKAPKVVAIWSEAATRKQKGARLWALVDLSQHPDKAVGRKGVLELYIDDETLSGVARISADPIREPEKGEVPLVTEAASEIPSLEQLLQKPPAAVAAWLKQLKKLGWDLCKSADDPAFPMQTLLDAYREQWSLEHPLYQESAYMQLDGWPITWPDDEGDADLRRRKLILRTYHDAEPWVEVFAKGKGLEVLVRTT